MYIEYTGESSVSVVLRRWSL